MGWILLGRWGLDALIPGTQGILVRVRSRACVGQRPTTLSSQGWHVECLTLARGTRSCTWRLTCIIDLPWVEVVCLSYVPIRDSLVLPLYHSPVSVGRASTRQALPLRLGCSLFPCVLSQFWQRIYWADPLVRTSVQVALGCPAVAGVE